MAKEDVVKSEAQSVTREESVEKTDHALGSRDLKSGVRGDDVAALQRKLGLNPTGIYNAETEKKVKYIQRIRGLDATGTVDKAVLNILK